MTLIDRIPGKSRRAKAIPRRRATRYHLFKEELEDRVTPTITFHSSFVAEAPDPQQFIDVRLIGHDRPLSLLLRGDADDPHSNRDFSRRPGVTGLPLALSNPVAGSLYASLEMSV
jgi:hypothetical protein